MGFINHVTNFAMFEIKFCYWEQQKILQFWNRQARPRFAFNQFHGRNYLFECVRRFKAKCI